MAEKLGPTRVVAILPIAVVEGKNRRQQAEVCRGIACFLERRFSHVSGLETILPHPGARLASGESVLPPEFAHRHLREHQPTHILRGYTNWEDDESFRIRFEMMEIATTETIFEESAEVAANREGLEELFRLMGALARKLTGSDSVARLTALLPTRSARAFRQYVAALAAADSWRRGLADAQRCFDYLLEALRFDPQFYDAVNVLVQMAEDCVAEEGAEARAAVTALQEAVEVAPGEPLLHAHLGLALRATHNHSAARERLKQYLDRAPRGDLAPQCMAVLAEIERETGDHSAAIDLLRRSLHMNPESAERWEMLGDLFDERREYAAAAGAWRRGLQEDPDRPRALMKLAQVHLRRGEHPQARFLLERLLSLQPRNEDARNLIVESHLLSGDRNRANEAATAWAESDSASFRAWMMLARVRLMLGHRDAVHFCMEKASPSTEGEELERLRMLEELDPPAMPKAPLPEEHGPALEVPLPAPSLVDERPHSPSNAVPAEETMPRGGFLRALLRLMQFPFRPRNRRK